MKAKANEWVRTLTDAELLSRLSELVRQSRRLEAELIAHIGEVDARRLYASQAASSMFVYCTRLLHLSEAEAYLRIAVARAARKHPDLLTMLADGRLHLSGAALIAPHLTAGNRAVVLRRAAHRSKRQIEELVAELAPRPEVPATVRKLPEPRAAAGGAPPAAVAGGTALLPGSEDRRGGVSAAGELCPDEVPASPPALEAAGPRARPPVASPPRGDLVQPLAASTGCSSPRGRRSATSWSASRPWSPAPTSRRSSTRPSPRRSTARKPGPFSAVPSAAGWRRGSTCPVRTLGRRAVDAWD